MVYKYNLILHFGGALRRHFGSGHLVRHLEFHSLPPLGAEEAGSEGRQWRQAAKAGSGGRQWRQAVEAGSGGRQRRQAVEAGRGGKQRREAAEAEEGGSGGR